MIIERLTNQELASEVEHWANKSDNNTSGEWPVTGADLRTIAARLRLPTDDDLDAAVQAEREAVLARVKKRIDRRATLLNGIISEIENLAGDLENDGDSRHYESDVEDDDE